MGCKLPLTDYGDVHTFRRIERQQTVELQAALSRAAAEALAPMVACGESTERAVSQLSPADQRRLGALSMDTRTALAVVLWSHLRLSGRARRPTIH